MSLERKIKRRQSHKKWKENMKGVSKKYRTIFRDYWKKVNRRKRR